MGRQSAPTERVLQALGAFQESPREPLSLAAVVARTGLAPATCLGILNTLRKHGYLVRADDKTFMLGPAAIRLGSAAQSSAGLVDLVRPVMLRLSARWEGPCTASAIVDGYVTVLARIGPAIANERSIEVGRRFPLQPPFGLLNLVWYPDEAIQAWVDSTQLLPVSSDLEQLRSVVMTARSTGYLVERWKQRVGLDALIDLIADKDLPPHMAEALSGYVTTLGERVYIEADLDGPKTLEVSSISAPIYDATGQPVLLLLLYLLREEMPISDVRSCGAEILAAAEQITREISGFNPYRMTDEGTTT